MASQRQLVGQWFLLDENSKFNSGSLDEKELNKGWEKCLKDLSLSKTGLPFGEFRGYWRAVLRGAFKPLSHTTNVSTKPEVAVSDIKLELWTPGEAKYDKKMFQTYKTGKGIDVILSTHGGATKASTTVIIGEPGVGKTTVCADIQHCLQKQYPNAKIACVQAEMKRFDISYEFQENNMPWMSDIKYLILKDYGLENIKNTLIKIFTSGYDVLFLDSIENIVKKLGVYADMSHKEAENFLLELFDHANDGKNNKNEKGETVYTTIFAIQQVTKGGEFKGDNALKHETTAMMVMRKDDKGNRYVSHEKHRRCGKHVDKRLFYSLNEKNEVVYDLQMFEEAELQIKVSIQEKADLAERTKGFYETFKRKGSEKEDSLKGVLDEIVAGTTEPGAKTKSKAKSKKTSNDKMDTDDESLELKKEN